MSPDSTRSRVSGATRERTAACPSRAAPSGLERRAGSRAPAPRTSARWPGRGARCARSAAASAPPTSPSAPRLPCSRRWGSCPRSPDARAPCTRWRSAAAVTWAIMNPELTPASCVRKGGSPWFRSGCTRRSMRRSEIVARLVSAMASTSSASATACPWKLPPAEQRAVVEHQRIVGGGVELARHQPLGELDARRAPARAPAACSGASTRPAPVDRPRGATRESRCPRGARGAGAPTRACPTWPRASWMRASNATGVPSSASTTWRRPRAPRAKAGARRRAPSAAMAVWACVPLMSVSPSLGPSTTRREAGRVEHRAGRPALAAAEEIALADQRAAPGGRAAPGRRSPRRCPVPAPADRARR